MNPDPVVFIVADGQSDISGLRQLIESSQLRTETFVSTWEFLERYNPERPGCVIVHVAEIASEGLVFQQGLASRGIEVPVIIISVGSDMAMAVRAMQAGAVSVLKRPVDPQLMLETVREAIDRDSTRRRIDAQTREVRQRLALLTPREREVLELLVAGNANKEVAARLNLSEKTIEIHRAHVMKKMQVPNLASLVRLVLLAQESRRTDLIARGNDD